MTEAKQLPINLVKPHPQLALRFRYEVQSLATLIRGAVSQDTPNGQLEPGRVVPRGDGEGYYVYIGVRRYYALKGLYEETKDERFAVFDAYVDSDTSPVDLFLRAKWENEEGKGERVALSVLEQVFGLSNIKDSISPEQLEGDVKRQFELAGKLLEKRLRRLFDIEATARFRFTLEHLERLGEISDEEDFYLSAACIAGYAVKPDRMEKAIEGREAAYNLKWFGNMFTNYKPPEKKKATKEAKAKDKKGFEIHKKDVITARCPACGTENMVQLNLKAEVTRLPGDPNGETFTATPEVVVMYACPCHHCPREFHVFIRPLGGRIYAVEASLSPKFKEPKEKVDAIDLCADPEEGVWQKIVEDKIVGVVRARSRPRKQ